MLTGEFLAAYAGPSVYGGSMARLVNQLVVALREKPSRFGYVLCVLVLSVVVFTLADFLPAPYDMHH
jgi:hypothetical protein